MKGIMFNLMESVIEEQFGEDLWDSLLDDIGCDTGFTSLGMYEDKVMIDLVDALAARMSWSQGAALVWFGRKAFPKLDERYPQLVRAFGSTAELVRHLDHVIHPEVHKVYPDAELPSFDVRDVEDGLLVIYKSKKRLCSLAEGFIFGAASVFGEEVDLTHTECMHEGDERCVMLCKIREGFVSG